MCDRSLRRSRLVPQANTDGEGAELWRSDGKRGGARLVEDIYRGGRGSAPRYLTPCGASLYFAADDGRYGDELWASDGSLGHLGDDDTRVAPGFQTSGGRGTHLVHDVRAGRDGGAPKHLACLPASAQSGASARDVLFFAADDGGAHGEELWAVKAGRRGGATLVRDVRPGRRGSSPRYMTAFGSRVFFQVLSRDVMASSHDDCRGVMTHVSHIRSVSLHEGRRVS